MLALILEGQLENRAKRGKASGEIPDHIGETRQSYKAESQGESTLCGAFTNGRETPGINVIPVAEFLQNPGKPKIEFSTWLESFQTYFCSIKNVGDRLIEEGLLTKTILRNRRS